MQAFVTIIRVFGGSLPLQAADLFTATDPVCGEHFFHQSQRLTIPALDECTGATQF